MCLNCWIKALSSFLLLHLCVGVIYADVIYIRYPAASPLKTSELLTFERDLFHSFPRYSKKADVVIVEPDAVAMSADREWLELLSGDRVNVLISPLQPENKIHGVKVLPYPVMRGILGFRQIVTTPDTLDKLSKVKSLKDILAFSIGQPEGWLDFTVYSKNGFNMVAGRDIKSMLGMLEYGRFDLFPLGVIEVGQVFDRYVSKSTSLSVSEDTFIYYYHPMVLHVNETDTKLHSFLSGALQKMLEDGTLDLLLERHYGQALKKLNTTPSVVIRLRNPNIPISMQRDDSEHLYPRIPELQQ